ncbi:hypothetical protein L6164_017118 [Bauhinia variegata]|uniref:Uncharacterized protein n=1 Tax=Bauhinia variegata TaxID=167791 RepID=A0ACB9N6P5_BAUVA|nr:hypothetical protein L6164_017118 [Bauhinia variegata]
MVDFTCPIPNFLNMESDIRLTLAPRSHRALPKFISPIVHGIEKLPGSLSFGGNFYCKIALYSSVSMILSSSSILLFFDKSSFINFAYDGICSSASAKGILM